MQTCALSTFMSPAVQLTNKRIKRRVFEENGQIKEDKDLAFLAENVWLQNEINQFISNYCDIVSFRDIFRETIRDEEAPNVPGTLVIVKTKNL